MGHDFTYVRTWAGFSYVAFIVDVFAQKIVAWHACTSKATDLVMVPLRMALWQRDREGHPVVPGELIKHSDAGSQYTSVRLTEHLALQGIRPSIGTVGDAYDNALMETINGRTRPSASAPPSSTTAPTRPWPRSGPAVARPGAGLGDPGAGSSYSGWGGATRRDVLRRSGRGDGSGCLS